jgi:hypothetical protein
MKTIYSTLFQGITSSGGGGDSNNKGYFVDQTALETAYPTGQAGWFAIVGSTDTVWVWDTDTEAWVNSGMSGASYESQVIGATAKTTPADADLIGIVDSADSNNIKKLSWANAKETLKTGFDTLYQETLGFTPENVANKEDATLDTSATKYPTNRLVKENIDLKLDKAGDTMTGNLEFGAGKGVITPIIAESTTARTLALTDAFSYIRTTNGSETTITIPLNSSVAFAIGTQVVVWQQGEGDVVFEGAHEDVAINAPSLMMSNQYKSALLIKVNTNEWDLIIG